MTIQERRCGPELAQGGGNARSDPRVVQQQRVVSGEGSRSEDLGDRRQLQAHLHPSRDHPNGRWDRSGDPHRILE